MVSFKGHFDGKTIILDEPATLVAGQSVRVELIDSGNQAAASPASDAPWKGKLQVQDEKKDVILADFKDYLP